MRVWTDLYVTVTVQYECKPCYDALKTSLFNFISADIKQFIFCVIFILDEWLGNWIIWWNCDGFMGKLTNYIDIDFI